MTYNKIIFKDLEYKVIKYPSTIFSGYKITYQEKHILWKIEKLINNNEEFQIKFWPSKIKEVLNILAINYELQLWYNSKEILDNITFFNEQNQLNGQLIKYKDGQKDYIRYYDKGINVTEEVLNITENREVLTDEDKFNLYVKYGSYFKLYDDYTDYINFLNVPKIIEFCKQ